MVKTLRQGTNNEVFIDKRFARTALRSSSEGSRERGVLEMGIVCECCMNSCSLRELKQYCHSPPPKSAFTFSSSELRYRRSKKQTTSARSHRRAVIVPSSRRATTYYNKPEKLSR